VDTPSVLAELRDRQRTLAKLLDQIAESAPGSAEFDSLYGKVSKLVHDVVAARNDLPRLRYRAAHAQLHFPIRIMAGVLAAAGVGASVLAFVVWAKPLLLVLAMPAVVLGCARVMIGAGPDEPVKDDAGPVRRLVSTLVGLSAVTVIYLAGFLSSWIALAVIPIVLVPFIVALDASAPVPSPAAKEAQ
jgi:hypothetical protein